MRRPNWVRIISSVALLGTGIALYLSGCAVAGTAQSPDQQAPISYTQTPNQSSTAAPTLASTSGSIMVPTATLAPTRTPYPTVASTPTGAPIVIEGKLYFDLNGNGAQDNASFLYPANPDIASPALHYFMPGVTGKTGEFITVNEPGLRGFTVCIEEICGITATDGSFNLSLPGDLGDKTLYLKITDPQSGNPQLAMRYFNNKTGKEAAPGFVMGGVTVPEITYNITGWTEIDKAFKVQPSAHTGLALGMVQGLQTSPINLSERGSVMYYYDRLPGSGVLSWLGDKRNNCKHSPFPIEVICNDHFGVDFTNQPRTNQITYATTDGILYTLTKADPKLGTANNVTIGNVEGIYTGLGHLKLFNPIIEKEYNAKQTGAVLWVRRGTPIGIMGKSGNTWVEHTHMAVYTDPADINTHFDPYSLVGTGNPQQWTLWNTPVQPASAFYIPR